MNSLTQKNLKERMNFSKMMETQEKQIKNSPVVDLIQPTDIASLKKDLNDKSQENLLNNLSCHLDLIEKKMTKSNKLIYFLLSIIALSLFLQTFRADEKSKDQTLITSTSKHKEVQERFIAKKFINLRSSPSTKSKKLKVIPPHAILKRIEAKNNWSLVEFNNQLDNTSSKGWVYNDLIKMQAKPVSGSLANISSSSLDGML